MNLYATLLTAAAELRKSARVLDAIRRVRGDEEDVLAKLIQRQRDVSNWLMFHAPAAQPSAAIVKWTKGQLVAAKAYLATRGSQPAKQDPAPAGVVLVPRSHYDDFISHLGWWATPHPPGVAPGQRITFELEGGPVPYLQRLEATIITVSIACLTEEGVVPNVDPALVGWHVIEYRGEFVEPPEVLGEEVREGAVAEVAP